MKRAIGSLLVLLLLVISVLSFAGGTVDSRWVCPHCSSLCTGSYCANDGYPAELANTASQQGGYAGSDILSGYQEYTPVEPGDGLSQYGSAGGLSNYGGITVYATPIKALASRSGPNTKYNEYEGFNMGSTPVRLLSRAEGNGVDWVQCEITYKGEMIRFYTGAKRFDPSSFDLYALPTEAAPAEQFRVNQFCTPFTGPGEQYRKCPYTLSANDYVWLISEENGWYCVEWETIIPIPGKNSNYHVRAWLPAYLLDIVYG